MKVNRQMINSIYRATEGEGVFVGRPQIFVRYQGCAVGCLNCDSKDTWEFAESFEVSIDEVLEKIYKVGLEGKIKNISITGGDPLHPAHTPHVLELVKRLKDKKYYINIEAAGTRVVDEIFDLVDYISFDLKTPSSGVRTPLKLISRMNTQFKDKFQIKAVIENHSDFTYALDAYKQILNEEKQLYSPWVLTPSYNTSEEFPLNRFMQVLSWNEEAGGFFRVIGQQHKWIFGPDQKQV